MSSDSGSNVYPFPTLAGLVAAGSSEQPDEDGRAEGGDAQPGTAVEDMDAMIKCLRYLYRETKRLEANVTSRLIGAAMISLRQDLADRTSEER